MTAAQQVEFPYQRGDKVEIYGRKKNRWTNGTGTVVAREEWRVANGRIEGPRVSVRLDACGRLAWAYPNDTRKAVA